MEEHDALIHAVVRRKTVHRLRSELPLSDQDLDQIRLASSDPEAWQREDFAPPLEILRLVTDEDWNSLDDRISANDGSAASFWPWRRVLSLLRGLKARTCVIESEYICLDYRSELASFYSQLNTQVGRKSIRLHFFSSQVEQDELFCLADSGKDVAYLGYCVCRPGDLPLVGRTIIKTPDYIQVPASVSETVYFLGQRLRVEGVPFMQQDERFAVCAHVAAWSAHYSAYRRGLVERKLIADIVAGSRTLRPMKPVPSQGLGIADITRLFTTLGLRAEQFELEWPQSLPRIRQHAMTDLGRQTLEAASDLMDMPLDQTVTLNDVLADFDDRRREWYERRQDELYANHYARDEGTFWNDLAEPERALEDQDMSAEAQFGVLNDAMIEALVRPYVESRWPVVCLTGDHALLLCGLSHKPTGEIVFFFHDDNYGPYLASQFAYNATRADFQYQAFMLDEDGRQAKKFIPNHDRAPHIFREERPVSLGVPDRQVRQIVVPLPTRFLLSPSAAEEAAVTLLAQGGLPCDDRQVKIMMGTDFKDIRLAELRSGSGAAQVYATIALAEWVIVVEGVEDGEGDPVATWEFVFDGTSGDGHPLVQLARWGRHGVYIPAAASAIPQVFELDEDIVPSGRVPSTIGKRRDNERVSR
jgi:hypothetical protein